MNLVNGLQPKTGRTSLRSSVVEASKRVPEGHEIDSHLWSGPFVSHALYVRCMPAILRSQEINNTLQNFSQLHRMISWTDLKVQGKSIRYFLVL